MTKRNRIAFSQRIAAPLVEKFAAVCERERRALNAQLEIVLEEWLAQYEKKNGPLKGGKH